MTLRAQAEQALTHTQNALLKQQTPDGRWEGFNDGGCWLLASHVVLMRYLGALSEEDQTRALRELFATQLEDGSAPPWRFARHGTLDVTCCWYAALRAAQVSPLHPALVRAMSYIDSQGGYSRATLFPRLLLAVAGVVEPGTLPTPPLALRLIPGIGDLMARFMGLNHLMLMHTATALSEGLRRGAPGADAPLRAAAARDFIDYMSARQAPSGSFAGVPLFTLLSACALVSLGIPRDDPRIQKAAAYAAQSCRQENETLRARAFLSDYWDTAQFLHGLLCSGLPAEHHSLQLAAAALLTGQNTRPSPSDWQTPRHNTPLTGGWPYQSGNELNPDIDSTSEILGALGAFSQKAAMPELTTALSRGESWMLSMQNQDGGWAAFSTGKPTPPPGPLFLSPRALPLPWRPRNPLAYAAWRVRQLIAENGDPSTADITGRVLWALGTLGHNTASPPVQQALQFLQRHQVPGLGAWWGRWACNYLASTAYILAGLAAVKLNPQTAWVQNAIRWVLSCQNSDGGWGESLESYTDLSQAGRGPSTVTLTGILLWALLENQVSAPDVLECAVRFLLSHQDDAGRWQDQQCYAVIIPTQSYYHNDTHATCFALEGLAAWLRQQKHLTP